MSVVRFTGEDEQGESITFDGWEELAEAQPWALIDPASLTDAQRAAIVAEMSEHAELETVKGGDEQVQMRPDGFNPEIPALQRFAARNLPRFQRAAEQDILAIVESEAAGFLERKLGGFHGLRTTYVQRRGRAGWRVVTLERGQPTECERLIDLFALNKAPHLSPLWHAIRVLVASEDVRCAMVRGDMQGTVNAAVTVGESRKALGIKLTRAKVGASGGRRDSSEIAQRDEMLRKEAAAIRARSPHLSNSAVANRLRTKFGLSIERDTIERIIKVRN